MKLTAISNVTNSKENIKSGSIELWHQCIGH